MGAGAKIFSSVMAQRSRTLIKNNDARYQFGSAPGVRCQDGVLTLRTTLHARHDHNVYIHADFEDLTKAFDTVDHEALMLPLAKFVALPKFSHYVERVRKGMQIALKIGTANSKFGKGTGA